MQYSPETKTLIAKVAAKINQLQGSDLRAQSARGVLFLGFGNGLERVIRLIRNMILTRLLAPDIFGLMAIVLATSVVIETLTDVGVKQAVIHHPQGAEEKYLNIAWWFQTIRGIILFGIAFLIASWIGVFYENPELTLFLRVSFCTILFQGLLSPKSYVLEKELRFGRWIIIGQGGAVLGTVVTVLLAFCYRNAWALVLGFTSEAFFRCLLSYVVCPFWPNLRFDRYALGELFKYVRGMIGVSLLAILAMQIDVFILGKLMPAAQVGIYVMALNLATQPARFFRLTVGTVLMSAYAKKQDDLKAVYNLFLNTTRMTIVLGIPFIIFAVFISRFILSVIWGPSYAAAAIPFGIMCISILFRMQLALCGTAYLALGKPNMHRRFLVIVVVVLLTAMYPGIKYFGLIGAASVLLLADMIGLFMHITKMPELIGLRFRDYITCWLPCVWLLPVTLWPVAVFRPLGIISWKLETLLAMTGLSVSYLVYFNANIFSKGKYEIIKK